MAQVLVYLGDGSGSYIMLNIAVIATEQGALSSVHTQANIHRCIQAHTSKHTHEDLHSLNLHNRRVQVQEIPYSRVEF